jgi:hypothetical protein
MTFAKTEQPKLDKKGIGVNISTAVRVRIPPSAPSVYYKKVLCTSSCLTRRWRCKLQNGTETENRLKLDLFTEIETLENYYKVLSSYLAGSEYEVTEIRRNLQTFKDSLSRASAYLLTLYNLKGQRIKIPWESLFTNLDHALASMELAPSAKLRTAVQLALNMSEPKIEQVMSYLVNLKEFLK